MAKCKYCKEERESFQMKTKDLCNICAYEKNQKEEWDNLKKKIKVLKL